MFVLLPEPDGASSGLVVRNSAGAQNLTQPYQAVRVERADVAPSPPFVVTEAEVKAWFGPALAALPAKEVEFLLYFDENKDVLNAESQAKMPAILEAIRERGSTAITITGHTDTTGAARANYELGLRRAERVAEVLRNEGVDPSHLFVSSHGEADLLVKTGPGQAEARNRRVEIIVR